MRVFPHRVGEQAKDSMFTLLFDESDGHLLALISLDELGPLRTSAPVAFAARLLAPANARTLAVIGSGLQAHYHVQGLRSALPDLERIVIFSPTPENRQRFASELRAESGLAVETVESAREAVREAEVVAVTAGREPGFTVEDIRPGALITNIITWGMPRALYQRARLVAPSRSGPVHHASGWDPFPFKLNGGRDPSQFVTTLDDILRGQGKAREREDEIVLYEQSGSFAWDGAMTRMAYDWARTHSVGTQFAISSAR
jgi:ornithine cyclodeaminase/alanine dehydrogenase-like protein (mu-crystallin family)